MKDEQEGMTDRDDDGRCDSLSSQLDRIEFNERIAHLQRRARLQRRIIERLAAKEGVDSFAALQAMIQALEALEERNLVLEDAIRTVRTRLADEAAEPEVAVHLLHEAGLQGQEPMLQEPLPITSECPEDLIRAGRLEAEALRAVGDYRKARQLLRHVGSRKALDGIGLQLLASSRYRIVRKLFSFYRYR